MVLRTLQTTQFIEIHMTFIYYST